MAANFSKVDGVTPLITFASMIILGVIISKFVITEQRYKLTIILFSFLAGLFVASMEMRAIIGRRRREKSNSAPKLSEKEHKQKLARYVADLFDEDIPFEEFDDTDAIDPNQYPEE